MLLHVAGHSPRIRALRMLMMMDAVVLTGVACVIGGVLFAGCMIMGSPSFH